MRAIAHLALVLVSIAPMSAFAMDSGSLEPMLPDGRLAAAHLSAGDYRIAAKRLSAALPDGINDAARLINLGNAYAGMGKVNHARTAYSAARTAPEAMLMLADGSEASSREIALRALNRLKTQLAVR